MGDFVVIRGSLNSASTSDVGYIKFEEKSVRFTITEGSCVWEKLLDDADLETYAKQASVSNVLELRQLLRKECKKRLKISSNSSNDDKIIEISMYSKQITFEIPRKASTNFKKIIFDIAEHAHALQQKVDDLEAQNKGQGFEMFSGFNQTNKKRKADKVQRKPGMSMLNPSSKKSKAPSGVVFD